MLSVSNSVPWELQKQGTRWKDQVKYQRGREKEKTSPSVKLAQGTHSLFGWDFGIFSLLGFLSSSFTRRDSLLLFLLFCSKREKMKAKEGSGLRRLPASSSFQQQKMNQQREKKRKRGVGEESSSLLLLCVSLLHLFSSLTNVSQKHSSPFSTLYSTHPFFHSTHFSLIFVILIQLQFNYNL